MEKVFVGIRDINEAIFRKFRALAIERRLKLGDAVTKAMEIMIKKNKENLKTKKLINIIKTKPFDFGEGNENISNEIDMAIYGGK